MATNSNIVYSTLLISLIFVVIMSIITYMAVDYRVQVDPTYQEIFNKFNETRSLYQVQQSTLDAGEINPAGFDAGLFKNVIIVGKQLQQSARLFTVMMSEIPKVLGIDPIIMYMLITLVLVSSAFAFVRLLTKEDP